MITVITSEGNSIESKFDLRFGRADHYCVFDDDNDSVEFVKNAHKEDSGAAGTKAAETMVEYNVVKVISGHFGPKAKDLLDKFNIQMVVITDESSSVQDIIDKIKK